MFLSRITLNKAEALQQRIFSPYDYHRALWLAFPGRPEADRDFLFRWDDRREEYFIYMLSTLEPTVPDWGCWKRKRFEPVFSTEGLYRFQLRANPVVRRKESGRLCAVTGESELADWLARQAARSGFVLAGTPESMPPVVLRFSKGQKVVTHQQVDFTGLLQVTDEPLFREAFRAGIGRGKAFGSGMLLVQRIK